MELEQLKIFRAVAECLSFTKAARQLYISHSTTSRAVAALEGELGLQLLQRDKHSVSLTPAGESMLRYSKEILELTDSLADKVREESAPEKER